MTPKRTPSAAKPKKVTGIPATEINNFDQEQSAPAYFEKINPAGALPAVELPDALSLTESKRAPRIYIEEETEHDKIGFAETTLYTGLHLKRQPVIAYTEDGQKIKMWDFENKFYTFYLNEKGDPVRMIEKTRELVQEFFTVLTRGQGATIFKWQNRREAWLKFNPDTPGIRMVGTYISFGAAIRAIEKLSPSYRITLKSCVTFKSYFLKKAAGGYNVIDPETGTVINWISEHNFYPAE